MHRVGSRRVTAGRGSHGKAQPVKLKPVRSCPVLSGQSTAVVVRRSVSQRVTAKRVRSRQCRLSDACPVLSSPVPSRQVKTRPSKRGASGWVVAKQVGASPVRARPVEASRGKGRRSVACQCRSSSSWSRSVTARQRQSVRCSSSPGSSLQVEARPSGQSWALLVWALSSGATPGGVGPVKAVRVGLVLSRRGGAKIGRASLVEACRIKAVQAINLHCRLSHTARKRKNGRSSTYSTTNLGK